MSRGRGVVWWVLTGGLGVVAAALTLIRWLGPDTTWGVQLTAFAPMAVAPYTLALVALGIGLLRGIPLVPGAVVGAVLATGLAVHFTWLSPLYLGGAPHPADGADEVVVMAVNAHFGKADAEAVAMEVSSAGVDVLVVSEVTDAFLQRLSDTDLDEVLPYGAGDAGASAEGTMVLSNQPVRLLATADTVFDSLVVEVAGMRIVAAHPPPPTSGNVSRWLADHAVILDAAREHHADLVVGDLNATLDHEPMRRLVGAGWRDAEELTNGGFEPTWPAHGEFRFLFRPVAQIDHVMAADTTAVIDVARVDIPDTDHLAVVATVAAAAQ